MFDKSETRKTFWYIILFAISILVSINPDNKLKQTFDMNKKSKTKINSEFTFWKDFG